ncbi:MAG: hypothetical protein MUD14_00520 [Hydrococcus sp. Prado102]|jgi:hypothetical protein|nr:hypothetical protein [Hydrococcus sp. Prado102]
MKPDFQSQESHPIGTKSERPSSIAFALRIAAVIYIIGFALLILTPKVTIAFLSYVFPLDWGSNRVELLPFFLGMGITLFIVAEVHNFFKQS